MSTPTSIAELTLEHVPTLAGELGDAFYLDERAMRRAVERKRSFNVIHLETMFKVDVFIPKRRAFDRAQLERRASHVVATEPERKAFIASAEDTILAKLDWYRAGGEVSERQWSDIAGVLRVQQARLDER